MLKNSVRISASINTTDGNDGYQRNTDEDGLPADDDRFIENHIPMNAIAASSGQNDSGVFELSFRDERYLPFEAAGAISQWSLELFSDLPANNPDPANPDFGRPLRQFDYHSITDVVLHVKYTARGEGGVFKDGAIAHLREYFSQGGAMPSRLLLNLRRDFPSPWSRFLHPANPVDGNVLEFEMSPELFPFRDAGKTLKVNTIYLLARCTEAGDYGATLTLPLAAPPPAGATTMTLAKSDTYGGLHVDEKALAGAVEILPSSPPAIWRIRITPPGGGNLTEDPVRRVREVEDLILVVEYEWA